MKILIIDDDQIILKIMSYKLQKEGHVVLTADIASDALTIINKEKLDLIISDIMMPYMSGLELLNIVKSNFFNNVPVVLMSSLDQDEVISTSMDLGASNYLTKPVNYEQLGVYVNTLKN
jgi:DNA-binding response OmpR family regulator